MDEPIVALKKFFIGGLSWTTTEESVKQYFEDLGFSVEKTQIMRNKSSGRSRGFGFIIFFENDQVDEILPSYLLDGRQIEVKFAVPKEEMGAKTKKIFVGGLPVTLGEAAFHAHFQEYGPIVEAQIMKDRKNSRSRGFGFIRFQSEDSVEEVLKHQHIVNGKLVEVKKALPKHALSSLNQEELSMLENDDESMLGSLPSSNCPSPKPRSPIPMDPIAKPKTPEPQLELQKNFFNPRPPIFNESPQDNPFIFRPLTNNFYFPQPIHDPTPQEIPTITDMNDIQPPSPSVRQPRSPFISVQHQSRASPSSPSSSSTSNSLSPAPNVQPAAVAKTVTPPSSVQWAQKKTLSPVPRAGSAPIIPMYSHMQPKRLVSSEPHPQTPPGSPSARGAWGSGPPREKNSCPTTFYAPYLKPAPPSEFLDPKEKQREDDRLLVQASDSLFHTSVNDTIFSPNRMAQKFRSSNQSDDDIVIRSFSFELGKPKSPVDK